MTLPPRSPLRPLLRRFRRRQTGVSLIELMISITIGLALLAGITMLISYQSSTRADMDKAGRQVESGRYAFTLLQDDIQHAGYYGQYGSVFSAPAALPDPCATDTASIDDALAMPLQGYDAPLVVPAPLIGCLPDANHVPGTDILVVRRVETGDVLPTVATAAAGQIYIQASPSGKVVASGPDPTPATPSVYTLKRKDGVTPAELRRFVTHIYFVSPCNRYDGAATTCSAGADGGKPVPTLKRMELASSGGGTTFVTVPLVDGIQNLQFDYGVDAGGAGAPTGVLTTAPALADWPNVVTVQLSLLARTAEVTSGEVDGKAYNMGLAGTIGPFSDHFRRHVYTGTVRAINPSSRKE